jgi:hypothetical protein
MTHMGIAHTTINILNNNNESMSEEREKDSSIFILESDGRITEELNPNFLESVSDQTL